MTKVKRFVATLLCVANVCSISGFAAQESNSNLISFDGDLNAAMMSEIPASGNVPATVSEDDSVSDFTIELSENNDGSYTGSGKVLLENGLVDYVATGNLSQYTLSNGSIAYIGTIVDDFADGSQLLSLTVHTIPTQEKMFVLANSSIKDENGVIVDHKVYAYGELFSEMNEFVPLYTADRNSYSDGVVETDGYGVAPAATASDYNTKFVKTAITRYGNDTGGYYDLIALSAFAPNAMRANGQYYMYGKVNSHRDNARAYASTFLTIGVVTGISVDQGSLTMTAEKNEIGFTLQSPEDKTINVKIPVPVPNGTGGVTIKTFTVPIITVDAELRQVGNYNTNNLTNSAYWYFGGNNNISWSSSVAPKDTEKAYAGQGYLTNFNNLTYDTPCNMAFSGTLLYSYTSQYGAIQYSGSFGASASYDHEVTLSEFSA